MPTRNKQVSAASSWLCTAARSPRAEKLCVRVGQVLLFLPLQHATILCVGFDSCAPLEAVLGIFQQLQIITNE